MSIISRWQMDAKIDAELKKEDKSISSRWQMDAKEKKVEPKAFEKRCVFSKEDDADYLTNYCTNYDPNNREF